MQDTAQVYRDKVLSNIMLQYPAQGLVAEQLLPTLNVPNLTGVAFKVDESHIKAPADTLRSGFARANRVGFNLTTVSYGPLKEHSLETGITDLVMSQYDQPLTPESSATKVVSGQLLIEKEIEVRDLVTTAANYNSSNKVTLATGDWFDQTTSDPIGVSEDARKAVRLGCGNDANVVVMNPDVYKALRNHASVVERIKYSARVTRDELNAIIADVLGVSKVLIAEGVTTDQAEGSTTDGTKSYIWGDDMVFAYVSEAPALEELSFGYILRLDPSKTFGDPSSFVGVDKWYEKEIKSTIIRANDFYTTWQVAANAGYLVKNVLS